MSRYRAVFDRHGLAYEFQDGECTWARPDLLQDDTQEGPQVIRDLAPYKSMIDGSMIDGRKRHRDHLKAHNCIEVGNDTSHIKPRAMPTNNNRKQVLHKILADVSDRQLKQMIQREIKDRK